MKRIRLHKQLMNSPTCYKEIYTLALLLRIVPFHRRPNYKLYTGLSYSEVEGGIFQYALKIMGYEISPDMANVTIWYNLDNLSLKYKILTMINLIDYENKIEDITDYIFEQELYVPYLNDNNEDIFVEDTIKGIHELCSNITDMLLLDYNIKIYDTRSFNNEDLIEIRYASPFDCFPF